MRAEWDQAHPEGFPAKCRKSNVLLTTNDIILVTIIGTLLLFVVIVNWFYIRRFVSVALNLLPRLPRLRRPKRARNPHTVLSLYSLAPRGRPRVYRYLHAYVSVSFAFATHCCVLWLCPCLVSTWLAPWRPV